MEWISVNDRLPEDNGLYTFKNDSTIFHGFYKVDASGKVYLLCCDEDVIPTHWRITRICYCGPDDSCCK